MDDLPVGYELSDDGVYMDELPECPVDLKSVKSIEQCGRDFAFMVSNAKNQAIIEFKKNFLKALSGKFTQRANTYTGFIGTTSYNTNVILNYNYAGVMLTSQNYRGASITIKRILTVMDATTTFDLHVLKSYVNENGSDEVAVIPLQSTAGTSRQNELSSPIELPLSDDTGKRIIYYFVYNKSNFAPKNNTVSCGCGGRENDLKKYILPTGIIGNDLGLLTSFQRTNYVNGILLDADIRCGSQSIICEAYTYNELIRAAVQTAIQYKAVALLIWSMLNSNEINRDTMAKREQMEASAYRLGGKFKNDVQWISENIDLSDNDCYICNQRNDLYFKGGIR